MALGEVRKTQRGFEIIEFVDRYGASCSLQQSSLAEYAEPGTSAVWLGLKVCPPPVDGHAIAPHMHLDRKQVRDLVAVLRCWLKHGTF